MKKIISICIIALLFSCSKETFIEDEPKNILPDGGFNIEKFLEENNLHPSGRNDITAISGYADSVDYKILTGRKNKMLGFLNLMLMGMRYIHLK